MRVTPHKPVPSAMGERLVNASGIGLVELKTDETPRRIVQLCAEGKDVEFELDEKASRWE